MRRTAEGRVHQCVDRATVGPRSRSSGASPGCGVNGASMVSQEGVTRGRGHLEFSFGGLQTVCWGL